MWSGLGGTPGWFDRYEEPGDFERWHAMALASIIRPDEGYALGIDCADRWLSTRWGTKLVLTDERVVRFRADPADPIKQTYWIEDIAEVEHNAGVFTAEMKLIGDGFYEVCSVPKRLGREFAEAVENTLRRSR